MTDQVANPWQDAGYGCKPSVFKPKGVPLDDAHIINRLPDIGWRALWHAYREAMAGNVKGLAVIEMSVDGSITKTVVVDRALDALTMAGAMEQLKTDLLQAAEEECQPDVPG